MNERTPVKRGTLAEIRILLIFVLALGMLLLSGCSSAKDEGANNTPNTTTQSTEETTTAGNAARDIVVRVSGTRGTAYTGAYGPPAKTQVANGTLEAEPTDYELKVESEVGGVSAVFRKTEPDDEGLLRVEILANDELLAEDETYEEYGVVSASWSPDGKSIVERPGER